MNQKVLIIIVVVIAAVIFSGGGYFLYAKSQGTPQKNAQQTQVTDQSESVLTLSPGDIGLTLRQSDSGKFAGHGLVMTITKLDGISSIDCEFSYTSQGNLPRGGICKSVTVKATDSIIQQEYPYGTCSDVCHFDSDVSDIKMILKITKNDGKTYQVSDSL